MASEGPTTVVVLAGSAGAIPVLVSQVRRLPRRDGMALFIIYHRGSPVSFRWDLRLPPGAPFRAVEARHGMPVEANALYYPQGSDDLEVRGGRLVVAPPRGYYHPSIDRLLGSLADEYGPRVVAVLLSGLGRDGIRGLGAVRAAGGLAIVQDPAEAPFAGLPRAALAAGVVDLVMDAESLIRLVAHLAAPPEPAPWQAPEGPAGPP